MMSYDLLIDEAKRRLDVPREEPLLDLDGEDVQMSVRLPVGLRDAVNDLARRRGQTLSAFVTELLVKAVGSDRDPFVALASDLAKHTRGALATAVEVGDYAGAADEVDAQDATSTDR